MKPEEILNQALGGFADAVGNYAAGKTALSLNRMGRKERLEDIASQREYEDRAADKASVRRQKEFTEAERQRLIQHYAELGVPVSADDTIEKANSKFRTFQEDRASRLLDHFGANIKDVADRKVQTVQELQGLVRKKADPLTAREALTVTLANPAAVKDIPSDQLAKLKAVLNGPGDPEKVVSKVYDFMANDYWFRKGAAQNRASAFYQTFLTELNTRLDKSKQIDAALLMNQLNDLDKEGQEVVHKRDDLIATQAPFLNKDQIQKSHDTHPIAPPANPADAFKDISGPPPPSPGVSLAPPPPGGPSIAPASPALAAYPKPQPSVPPPVPGSNTFGSHMASVGAPAPFVSNVNPSAVPSWMNQSSAPMPASPDEVQQVKQLAISMGADPVKGEQAMASQDPQVRGQAVASFNLLLRQVRQKSMGMNTDAPPVPSTSDPTQ